MFSQSLSIRVRHIGNWLKEKPTYECSLCGRKIIPLAKFGCEFCGGRLVRLEKRSG